MCRRSPERGSARSARCPWNSPNQRPNPADRQRRHVDAIGDDVEADHPGGRAVRGHSGGAKRPAFVQATPPAPAVWRTASVAALSGEGVTRLLKPQLMSCSPPENTPFLSRATSPKIETIASSIIPPVPATTGPLPAERCLMVEPRPMACRGARSTRSPPARIRQAAPTGCACGGAQNSASPQTRRVRRQRRAARQRRQSQHVPHRAGPRRPQARQFSVQCHNECVCAGHSWF